jgi:hypothetical protein
LKRETVLDGNTRFAICAFIRRKRNDLNDAEDLTQAYRSAIRLPVQSHDMAERERCPT